MIRKLLLPAIAAALLSGCVTYGYRDGRGDYYYGQPGTEYRYYDGYGNPGYGYYGYPGYYGYSGYYGYGVPYWGGGYYRYYGPSHPRHDGGDHHHGGDHHSGDHQAPPPDQDRTDRPRAPWRDLGNVEQPSAVGKRRAETLPESPGLKPRMAPRTLPQRTTAPVRATPRTSRSGNRKRDAGLSPAP
jgi:hypothetical protein